MNPLVIYHANCADGFGEPEMLTAYSNFLREGEAIIRAHKQNVRSVVQAGTRMCFVVSGDSEWRSIQGLACNCPAHLTSDVGHELATQSGTFGLCWFQDSEGKVRCSLRSNGNYNVSAIAKVFGGGGHKNAAGFVTSMESLQSWLRSESCR